MIKLRPLNKFVVGKTIGQSSDIRDILKSLLKLLNITNLRDVYLSELDDERKFMNFVHQKCTYFNSMSVKYPISGDIIDVIQYMNLDDEVFAIAYTKNRIGFDILITTSKDISLNESEK